MIKKPLRLFIAMPGTDMGPTAQWNNPEQIKRRFFHKIKEELEEVLQRPVEMVIEKDKVSGGAIHPSMFREAWEADVYVADLTGNNPNVYLELGVRWALRDNVTVIVSQNVKDVKFNVSASRIIPYELDLDNLDLARDNVVRAVKEGLDNEEFCDSPVRQIGEIQSYRREYVERLKEENQQLKSERGKDYLAAAKEAEDPRVRFGLLNRAVEVNEYLDEAYFLRGVERRKRGDYKDAIDDLRRAISLKQNSSIYHRELGVAYNKHGQFEDAIQEFNEALRIDSKDAEVWSNRGGVLRRLGIKSLSESNEGEGWHFLLEARNSYDEAFKLDGLNHYALGNMGRIDLLLSKVNPDHKSNAVKELKRLRSLCEYKLADESGEKYWLMFDLADSYLLTGETTQGLDLYSQAIQAVNIIYRKSVLSTVISSLEEMISLGALDDQVNAAVNKVVEQLKQENPS